MKSMHLTAVTIGLIASCTFAAPSLATAETAFPVNTSSETTLSSSSEVAPVSSEVAPTSSEVAPAADAAVAPAAEVAAPVADSVAPVSEAVAAPVADTVAPASEPVAEPVAEAAAEPEAEPVAEPVEASIPAEESASSEAAAAEEQAEPSPIVAAMEAASDSEGFKAPKINLDGRLEEDAFVWGYNNKRRLGHAFSTTFDMNFDIMFTDNWAAHFGLEATGPVTNPVLRFNGGHVKYQNEYFTAKVGDLAFFEGAVKFYRFDDHSNFAAGMKDQYMRGGEIDIGGLQAAIGFSSNENTMTYYDSAAEDKYAYFVHVAYDWNIAGQTIRPYIDYKGFDMGNVNKFRAGLDLKLDLFNFLNVHATYGFYDDVITENDPKITQTILFEPTLTFGDFALTGSVYYAHLPKNVDLASKIDMPEYFFLYAEPSYKFNDVFKLGIMGEYHTNSLEEGNEKNDFAYFGSSLYITPHKNLFVKFFMASVIPLSEDGDGQGSYLKCEKDDKVLFDAGARLIINF